MTTSGVDQECSQAGMCDGAVALLQAVRRSGSTPEVTADWTAQHLAELVLIDVRERDELAGPLGRIATIRHIPLGQLQRVHDEVAPTDPVVIVCRSGVRSGNAARRLEAAGYRHVASLAGGMLSWHARGLPAVFGPPATHP